MKLITLLDLYIEEKASLSIPTIEKYQSVIRLFIQDTGINTVSVNRGEIVAWRNAILQRSSAGNCNNYHRHLKAVFCFAKKQDIIDSNPFQEIKFLKTGKSKSKLIKDSTLIKLITLLNNDPYYSELDWFYLAMVDVLSYTAIRRRQLIGIRWHDIDFEEAELYLSNQFSKNKNDNTIPLNPTLISSLLNLKKKSEKVRPDDQVFNITKFVKSYKPNKAGETTEQHISGLFTRFGKRVGENISPHRFRHAFATKIANNGGNLQALSDFLTHSDVRTTMEYVDADMESMRKIQNML